MRDFEKEALEDGFTSQQFQEAGERAVVEFDGMGRGDLLAALALMQLQRDRAEIDGLTHMMRRDKFEREYKRIENRVFYGARADDPDAVLVLFVDVKDLHGVNSRSHKEGDELLSGVNDVYESVKNPEETFGDEEALELFKQIVRGDDLACRFGGDEFVFAAPFKQSTIDPEQLQRTLDARINQALDRFNGKRHSSKPKLCIHRGYSIVTRKDQKVLSDALREADPKGEASSNGRRGYREGTELLGVFTKLLQRFSFLGRR